MVPKREMPGNGAQASYRPLMAAFLILVAVGGLVLINSISFSATAAATATTPLAFGLPTGIAMVFIALIAAFGSEMELKRVERRRKQKLAAAAR